MAKLDAKYEAMVVLSVKTNDEEQIKALISKFSDLIKNNGTLEGVDEWGKRKLAYEINYESEGYYVLYNFESKQNVWHNWDEPESDDEGGASARRPCGGAGLRRPAPRAVRDVLVRACAQVRVLAGALHPEPSPCVDVPACHPARARGGPPRRSRVCPACGPAPPSYCRVSK